MSEETVQIDGQDVTVKRVSIIQVGKGKTFVEVDANATFADLIGLKTEDGTEIGAAGTKVQNRGQEISQKADEAVKDGDTITIGPKAVKQG